MAPASSPGATGGILAVIETPKDYRARANIIFSLEDIADTGIDRIDDTVGAWHFRPGRRFGIEPKLRTHIVVRTEARTEPLRRAGTWPTDVPVAHPVRSWSKRVGDDCDRSLVGLKNSTYPRRAGLSRREAIYIRTAALEPNHIRRWACARLRKRLCWKKQRCVSYQRGAGNRKEPPCEMPESALLHGNIHPALSLPVSGRPRDYRSRFHRPWLRRIIAW